MTHEHNQNPLVPSLIGTLFVLGVLIFALLLAIKNTPLVVYVQESGGQTSPLGHSPSAESLTALLYILPTIAATFALAVWIKREPRGGIKVLIGISFAVATGLIGFFSYWWWLGTQYTAILIIGLVAAFILSFSYKSVFSVPFKIWLGVGIAALLFTIFPFTTGLVLCGIVAVWDMYAVFFGPLKSIASKLSAEHSLKVPAQGSGNARFMLNSMMVSFGSGALGLGDITFYSLPVMLTLYLSTIFTSVGVVSILSGVFLTSYILRSGTLKALPGLPLPILFFVVSMALLYFFNIYVLGVLTIAVVIGSMSIFYFLKFGVEKKVA